MSSIGAGWVVSDVYIFIVVGVVDCLWWYIVMSVLIYIDECFENKEKNII